MNTNGTPTLWFEPSSTSFSNFVDGVIDRDAFNITSDFASHVHFFETANGTKSQFPIATAFHSDHTASSVYGVFIDLGDAARTPDMGTTVSLFGFAIAGLAFFRRKLPQ